MKISARNVFEGKIENVEVGAVMANIKIKIESPELITAIITKESVEKLDLKKGDKMCIRDRGIAVSPYVKFLDPAPEVGNEIRLDTVCGTTIDGMLLREGIPVIPKYGGIVKVEDYVPTRFTELISYKKTSMTPLEAFTDKNMTSILEVIENGKDVYKRQYLRLHP